MAVGREDESALVASALRGEERGFRELLQRHQGGVYRLVLRMVRDPGVAEELTQEVFLRAFGSLGQFELGRSFGAWILRIARNLTIDHLRRRRLTMVPADEQEEGHSVLWDRLADGRATDPEAATGRTELMAALAAVVEELPLEYREIFLLRFVEELAYEEIAEVLDIPMGTVKTRIHRARSRLVAGLADRGWSA